MAKLFLGLDSSTQSLSAVIIDYDRRKVVYGKSLNFDRVLRQHAVEVQRFFIDYDRRKVVYGKSLNFDRVLPQYGTQNGVLPHPDPLVKHSSPLLWAEALDLLFAEMKKDGVALGEILAISGSGHQHGSVYLNARAAGTLAKLDPQKTLVENLGGIFSRPTSPIWMDSSTAVRSEEH